jgi:hypothetical protein
MITHIKNRAIRQIQQIISWYEIQLGSRYVPTVDIEAFLQSLGRIPKIALVKQDVCPDLYCCPPHSSPEQIVFSTLLRNGPLTLFTKFNADFWIVKTEDTAECEIWKEKCFNMQGEQFLSYSNFFDLQDKLPAENINNLQVPQGYYSVGCNEINWSNYDIIISIDIAVPSHITLQHPEIVWCYCLMEPYMKSHKTSSKSPIKGYDLFLNQRSRNVRVFPTPLFHEIDFPYCLQYYGCYHELLNIPLSRQRKGVFIEKHTARILSKEQLQLLSKYGPIQVQAGNTKEMIANLLKSKYFIRLGGNVGLRWANSVIESISAGCLFLGNPNEFVNKSLFSPHSTVYSFNELINRLDYYEQNNSSYESEKHIQQRLVNYLCFVRPIHDLFQKYAQIKQQKIRFGRNAKAAA